MPGVGVRPGLAGLPIVPGSGMPGVGVVPLGCEFTALAAFGIPGAIFAGGASGLAESPGGRLLTSTF